MRKTVVCILTFALLLAIAPCAFAAGTNPFRDADVGDTVLFGCYEQDDNTYNGAESISWPKKRTVCW